MRTVVVEDERGRPQTWTDLLPEHLITAQTIRDLNGWNNRRTLINHRKRSTFPQPVWTGQGQGGLVELWDIRDIQAWMRKRKPRELPVS